MSSSRRARDLLSLPFIAAIRLYQATLSPLMGGHCRFEPTCSRYGVEAYRMHGPIRGTWLMARRVLRCHPFGGGGYDPVPLPDDPKDDRAEQKRKSMPLRSFVKPARK